jgi:hypothetical protein
MSRTLEFEVGSAISVERIHAAYSEADYWASRLATYGDNGRLDAIDVVAVAGRAGVAAVGLLT